MLIDANTFSTIAAGDVQVSANTVRGINVDSTRKKFTLFTAKKRETEWSEKHGFTFSLEPTVPADEPQEIPDYGAMKAAERMGIPYEEYAAILKKARDEVEGDDGWEKELDAKNRAKAGIDGPDAETLERNAERLKRYEEKTDLSPYELLEKAQGCIGELKEAYTEQAEQKAVDYLSLSALNPKMSTYQLSNAYKELGSIDCLRKLAGGPGETSTITNGGKIRAMDDDRLAQEILRRWRAEMEAGKFEDISTRWCDMKGGCVSSKGYPRPCTEDRLLACIKRWLQQPAEEGDRYAAD